MDLVRMAEMMKVEAEDILLEEAVMVAVVELMALVVMEEKMEY